MTFGRFLKAYWGATTDLNNSGYDVDHLYNKARAKQATTTSNIPLDMAEQTLRDLYTRAHPDV